MAISTMWWIAAGACVVLELVSGTFYLLMLALGCAAAALAAMVGADSTTQVLAAAIVGGGAVAVWYVLRSRRPRIMSSASNPDLNLDIGEILSIDHWGPDGTASVHYRGARWTAVQHGTAAPQTGLHRVVAVVGNRLMVDKA